MIGSILGCLGIGYLVCMILYVHWKEKADNAKHNQWAKEMNQKTDVLVAKGLLSKEQGEKIKIPYYK